MALIPVIVKAQMINPDTVVKYSQPAEQLKLIKRVAADIHLDKTQTATFTLVSQRYAEQALIALKNKDQHQMDLLKALRGIGQAYSEQLHTFLSPEQIELLRQERAKYQLGRRFLKGK